MTPTRPLLRYHGGKWLLAPWIVSHFPQHRLYVEPYAGAASVLLRKPRSRAEIINDLDDDVCNLFRIVRDRGQELARALELTPFSRTEYSNARHLAKDELERARRLVIRSFMGFGSDSSRLYRNAGFRVRVAGGGQMPSAEWENYPRCLSAIISRLRGVVIENRPALEIIAQYDAPATFFYCDPPYVKSTRSACSNGRHTYRYEMSNEQHESLAEALHEIKGMAIVSGYECPLYLKLYKGWRKARGKGYADGVTGRRERTETVWLSPSIPKGLFQ